MTLEELKRREIEFLLPWHAAGTLSRREADPWSETLPKTGNSRGAMNSSAGSSRRRFASTRRLAKPDGARHGETVRRN